MYLVTTKFASTKSDVDSDEISCNAILLRRLIVILRLLEIFFPFTDAAPGILFTPTFHCHRKVLISLDWISPYQLEKSGTVGMGLHSSNLVCDYYICYYFPIYLFDNVLIHLWILIYLLFKIYTFHYFLIYEILLYLSFWLYIFFRLM